MATLAALPAEQLSDEPGPAPTTHPASSPLVLLAEDDREMREMIASVLTDEGYEVAEARDGSELISRLQELAARPQGRERLAVIISDVRMPRLDGLDTLAALRCARWYTPVILITAFGDVEVHRVAHDLGAVGVLDKPFSLSSLRNLVRQIAPH